ncbi:DoxX family protein [Hymenobacter negativus]|uniref:DoxX family protein n=1 Tax=Hymenobacter negativus TaxID=2795026 RepID=A0ABS3QLV1_9BACT|nr:DoxX family protein [Hymenobacter negativus]MBO2012237.1 DoxX family protein [Hymenobacter negativus]
MKNQPRLVVLFARLALGTSLLSAVADRLGLWGPPGEPRVSWGDWAHFVTYTAQVNSFAPLSWAPALAGLATVLEVVLGGCLLLGAGTRGAAAWTGLLLLAFALAMTLSFGPKPALNYSVWVAAGAAGLLASAPDYAWSIDAWRTRPRARGSVLD